MHLDQYLKEGGISQSDFRKKLTPPPSQGLVSQWVQGITRITLDYALQIDKESNHKVTPQDCADMYIKSDGAGRESGTLPRRSDDSLKLTT